MTNREKDLEVRLNNKEAECIASKEENRELKAIVAGLEKKFKESESQRESYWKDRCARNDEIQGLHVMLDTLPNSPPRKVKVSEYNEPELSLESRFMSWFAHLAFAHSAP